MRWLAAGLCFIWLAGCGYKLVDYSEPREGLGSVTVLTFSNDSSDPGVELIVADAMRREFLRRGAMTLSRDPSAADLQISGTVSGVRTRSRSFSTVSQVLEWEITLQLRVRASRSDGVLIPVDPEATEETDRYLASADIEVTRKNRREAIAKLSSVLAARVHDLVFEAHIP